MKKVNRKLSFVLILPVIMFSCVKKADTNNDGINNGGINNADIRTVNSISNPVFAASDPSTVISADLTAPNPGEEDIIVATQSEYNSMEYTDQIYYTGLRAAINYLFQSNANVATVLLYNIDATYSIVVNPTSTGNVVQQCKACTPGTTAKCMQKIDKYMRRNKIKTMNTTITRDDNGCLTIRYGTSTVLASPVITTGGTLVQTYTPSITYSHPVYNSYINSVKNWVTNTGSGPSSGGPVPHPGSWSREQLSNYIDFFNNDPLHPIVSHQTDAVYQVQLNYYVYNLMPAGNEE